MHESQARRVSEPRQSEAERTEKGYVAPASFAQQRLWVLDRFTPGTANYNIPRLLRLRGRLDESALRGTLDEIARRHDTLRTTFTSEGGLPMQVIAGELQVEMPVVDLRGLLEAEREPEARRLAEEQARHGFDLQRGPLWRAHLWRLGAEHHLLLLNLHHVISDGWSMGLLNRELTTLYGAFAQGQASPLSELPIQYADFSDWQREWLSGDVLARQLGYWREQLEGVSVLDLPLDRPRPATQTFAGDTLAIRIPAELAHGLQVLGQSNQVTLYMTLLAAFQVLMCRYSQQDDIAVGSPIAGRNRPELEELIGFFVNTLVLRTDLSGSPPFTELLKRVRAVCLGAYEHQELPFEKLVEDLRQERDLSRNPLFQVAFALQNTPGFDVEMPDCTVSQLPSPTRTAKFDLFLSLHQDPDGLAGTLNFNTDLFDAATIERMIQNFLILLEGIVDNPERPITDLPLLSEAEQRRPFPELNETETDYPRDSGIAELFETQVARQPDVTALVFEDLRLSYRELNARGNRLARYLATLGVGPGSLVGIAMPRSVDLVVGILGILKAGGAYVPLDLAYPKARLAFMLEDTAAEVLLTQSDLRERLPNFGGQTVCLDAARPGIDAQADADLGISRVGTDPAYVMYTSGSTGQPKGVEIPQRGVARLVCGADYVKLDSGQVHLLLAPIAFDASTFELWGALLNGGCCVCFPDETPTIQRLGEVIRREAVSTLWLTASLFNMIVDEAPDTLRGVKQLLTGGEALSVSHVRRAQAALPRTQIVNGYGPTESTTFACCHLIPDPVASGVVSIPIGRPISNTRVYVLDSGLNPVPVGVPGELYIGGDGLARGYLNQPALTAERFLPDPFVESGGGRVYKTGDRVRVLGDGTVEFLGRIDQQVKIRGYRIEPGEIEAVLAQHEAIRKVAVTVRTADEGGDRCLVAYVVPAGSELDEARLQAYLSSRLPAYMLPSAIVKLDALPITANGKIDLRALPAPVWGRSGSAETSAEPETEVERRLATLWCELLKLDRVGIHDNFFALGGHSLLATQLVSRLAASFSVELPLRSVFEAPTVHGLARRLESETASGTESIVPVQRELHRLPPEPDTGNPPPVLEVAGDSATAQDTEAQLAEIWRDCLGLATVDLDANFFEIGGHSLLGVKLLYEIERRFGKRLPLAQVFEHPTIREMAASIAGADRSTPSRTVVPIKATGSGLPFFCIHGRAEALVRHLDEEQPFYWLHHGQDAERTPYMTVEVIAAMHLEEIREIQPRGPYFLGGFSFGGLLALEIATQLRDQGEHVALLALFDPSAPHLSTELKAKVGTTLEAVTSAKGLWGKISVMAAKAVSVAQRRVRTLRRRVDSRLKMLEIRRRLRSGRELPPDLGVFRLVQQFRRAARIYDYRPYPGRVTLFVPEGRRSAIKQLERLEQQWRGVAMEGVDIHRVQGAIGHHQIVEEPYVRDLVDQLNACLAEARASRAQA